VEVFLLPTKTHEAPQLVPLYRSLLQQRDFTFLWWSQIAHWCGDAAYAIAILWIMQEMTGSTVMMGLVSALRAAPSVFGLVTGVFVDRWHPRNVLVRATFARALIVLSIPLLWSASILKPWHLLVTAVALGFTGVFMVPSRSAIMPAVVPSDWLIQANALMLFSSQVTQAISYSLAGVAISLTGTVSLFYFNASCMAVSALLLRMIRTGRKVTAARAAGAQPTEPAGPAAASAAIVPSPTQRRMVIAEMREGFQYIRSKAVLVKVLFLVMAMNFLITPLFVLLPVWTKQVLLAGPQTYGFIQSAHQVGMIAGSLLIGYVAARGRRSVLVFSALALQGVALLGLATFRTTQAALLGLGAFGLLDALANVTFSSYLQASVPKTIRGRVFSCIEALGQMTAPAGQALGGFLAGMVALPVLYLGIGVGRLVGPLAYGLSSRFRNAFDKEISVLDGMNNTARM
jgi:MFS family permease